jgi:hypothetical protein
VEDADQVLKEFGTIGVALNRLIAGVMTLRSQADPFRRFPSEDDIPAIRAIARQCGFQVI